MSFSLSLWSSNGRAYVKVSNNGGFVEGAYTTEDNADTGPFNFTDTGGSSGAISVTVREKTNGKATKVKATSSGWSDSTYNFNQKNFKS